MKAIEPIRILQVLGGLNVGGAETMVMNYYRNIDKSKVQFDFIVHENEKGFYEEEIIKMGGKIYRMPRYKGINHFYYIKKWKEFFKQHPEYKILHSHVRSCAIIFILIAKKYGVKTIIHSHSTSNGTGIKSTIKNLLQFPLRYTADYLFACSEKAGIWLYGKNAIKKNNFYIVKNSINLNDYIFSKDERESIRKKLGYNKDDIVLVHIGRFHESKNHIFLLRMFSTLIKQDQHKKYKLLLVGDGELRNNIEKVIDELCIKDEVKLLGVRSDVPKILQACDGFVFPSNWEGLPITVIEAQASGIPCFISNKITNEVIVTNLVKCLSIDNGFDSWVEEIEKTEFIRRDFSKEIIKSGYDINKSSEWLTNKYFEIIKDTDLIDKDDFVS